MYEIYGEEQGFIKDFDTLEECKGFIKELKETDKEMGIEDNYYIEEMESEEYENNENV